MKYSLQTPNGMNERQSGSENVSEGKSVGAAENEDLKLGHTSTVVFNREKIPNTRHSPDSCTKSTKIIFSPNTRICC